MDLYPPPHQWVPPNCIFEVDNITQPWTWQNNWDLIHISPSYRCLLGLPSLEHADIMQGTCLDLSAIRNGRTSTARRTRIVLLEGGSSRSRTMLDGGLMISKTSYYSSLPLLTIPYLLGEYRY